MHALSSVHQLYREKTTKFNNNAFYVATLIFGNKLSHYLRPADNAATLSTTSRDHLLIVLLLINFILEL